MAARKCADSEAYSAASPKKVATSDITAVTGFLRVMVKTAKKTVNADSSQKTTCSPTEALFGMSGGLPRRGQLGLEVGAELGEEPQHRPGRGVAERADGVAADAVGHVGQQVDVPGLAVAVRQAPADAGQPARALAAGSALAARLVCVELHDARAQ